MNRVNMIGGFVRYLWQMSVSCIMMWLVYAVYIVVFISKFVLCYIQTVVCIERTDGKIAENYSKAENTSVWADPVVLDATLVLHQQSGAVVCQKYTY